MPRRKAADMETPALPLEMSDGMKELGYTDDLWNEAKALAKATGNISTACDLLEVAGGMRAPKDHREAAELLTLSQKLQGKSLAAYTRFRESIEPKLASSFESFKVNRDRTNVLSSLMTDLQAIVHRNPGKNGQDADAQERLPNAGN